MAFASYYLMPHAAILDPRMTQTLPAHLTAMTAMDAMTHAIEAYTCSAANPLSDAYAQGASKKSAKTCLMSGKPIRCTSTFRTGTSIDHGRNCIL
jgi:alcohol dehydrogenase